MHWEEVSQSPNSFLFPPFLNASEIEWTFPLSPRGLDDILRGSLLGAVAGVRTIEALRILGLKRMAANGTCVYEIKSKTGYESGKALSRLFSKWGVEPEVSSNGPASEREEKTIEKRLRTSCVLDN